MTDSRRDYSQHVETSSKTKVEKLFKRRLRVQLWKVALDFPGKKKKKVIIIIEFRCSFYEKRALHTTLADKLINNVTRRQRLKYFLCCCVLLMLLWQRHGVDCWGQWHASGEDLMTLHSKAEFIRQVNGRLCNSWKKAAFADSIRQ